MKILVLGSGAREHAHAVEEMDLPGCDPDKLDRTYAQFDLVNRAVAGWHSTWGRYVRPVLSTTRPNTLLDIGSGGGDVPRQQPRGWGAGHRAGRSFKRSAHLRK